MSTIANTARLNCKIRPDIKSALEKLAIKRGLAEGGGKVCLVRIVAEAAIMLLRHYGVTLEYDEWGNPL